MIVTPAEILSYIRAGGFNPSANVIACLAVIHPIVEQAVKDHVGYDIEYNASVVEYQPRTMGGNRTDGDETSAGFDLSAGKIVTRSVGRNTMEDMILNQLPVRSITEIRENSGAWLTAGGDWPTTSILPASVYFLDRDDPSHHSWSGIVTRNLGSWNRQNRSIKITYAAGLTAAELAGKYSAFRMAILVAVSKALADATVRSKILERGGLPGSVTIEDFSIAYASGTAGQIGSFLGANSGGTAALPTESMQYLQRFIHMARLFGG